MKEIYLDIPRQYTAIAEWAACVAYVMAAGKMERKKWPGCIVFLFVLNIYFIWTGELDLTFWIPCMAGAVGLMYLFLFLMLDMRILPVLFLCARAFLMAEFAASLEWQLHVLVFPSGRDVLRWEQVLFMLTVYVIDFTVMYTQEKKAMTAEYTEGVTGKDCIAAMIVTVLCFVVGNISFLILSTPYAGNIRHYIFLVRTLVYLCGIVMLIVLQLRVQEVLVDREMSALGRALKSQYEQYRNYQQNFEMMNMKYHDLKHQIAGMRAEADAGLRKEWLDGMEQELDSLGDIGHTGNSVLDGILASKMRYCRKNGIRITCVADGRLLKSIHVADICTIFGNALDNAIECLVLIEDQKKRQIHFTVSKKKSFIFIRMENCCESELKIGKNGFPVTHKKDKAEHGYGMKSIRYTVEKYRGTMDYSMRDGWFELKILIPLPDKI